MLGFFGGEVFRKFLGKFCQGTVEIVGEFWRTIWATTDIVRLSYVWIDVSERKSIWSNVVTPDLGNIKEMFNDALPAYPLAALALWKTSVGITDYWLQWLQLTTSHWLTKVYLHHLLPSLPEEFEMKNSPSRLSLHHRLLLPTPHVDALWFEISSAPPSNSTTKRRVHTFGWSFTCNEQNQKSNLPWIFWRESPCATLYVHLFIHFLEKAKVMQQPLKATLDERT